MRCKATNSLPPAIAGAINTRIDDRLGQFANLVICYVGNARSFKVPETHTRDLKGDIALWRGMGD